MRHNLHCIPLKLVNLIMTVLLYSQGQYSEIFLIFFLISALTMNVFLKSTGSQNVK